MLSKPRLASGSGRIKDKRDPVILKEEEVFSVGSFSKDDGDGNEDGKKPTGLDWQNNNFARAARFLYIPLPSLYDYNVEVPNFTFCREHKTTTYFFFS